MPQPFLDRSVSLPSRFFLLILVLGCVWFPASSGDLPSRLSLPEAAFFLHFVFPRCFTRAPFPHALFRPAPPDFSQVLLFALGVFPHLPSLCFPLPTRASKRACALFALFFFRPGSLRPLNRYMPFFSPFRFFVLSYLFPSTASPFDSQDG